MILNYENYYSAEADREYMSASQFRNFNRCEEATLAQIQSGERIEPSVPMMVARGVRACARKSARVRLSPMPTMMTARATGNPMAMTGLSCIRRRPSP